MPVCEYFQQDIIIIALTSEDISSYRAHFRRYLKYCKTLCVAIIIVSNHVLPGRCVTTAVC